MTRSRTLPPLVVTCVALAACGTGALPGCKRAADQDPPPCQDEAQPRALTLVDDDAFDLGPYLMQTTASSVVVMWRTLEPGSSVVEFGTGTEPDQTVTGDDDRTVHEVTVSGLSADTRYVYRARTGATTSLLHHFRTAPEPRSGFRFTVLGDSQGHPETSEPLFRAMAATNPHFVLHVGDVVSDGTVARQWKEQFFDPLRPLGHEVPTFVAIGNHERQSDTYFDLVSYPNTGTEPFHESSYAFTWGNGFVLVVDSTQFFWPVGGTETDLSTWVRDTVASDAARDATWRIAATHQSGYSEGWSPGECDGFDGFPPVRDFLLPLLAENGFHLFLAGHTHAYERGFKDGILQVITGGGGGSLDEWCRDWPHVTRFSAQHHWLSVTAGCDALEVRATGTDGGLIDRVLLRADRSGEIVEQSPADGGVSP